MSNYRNIIIFNDFIFFIFLRLKKGSLINMANVVP